MKRSRPTLRTWGEVRLIEEIRRWLGAAGAPPPYGIGDDCAVLKLSGSPSGRRRAQLATVDPVICRQHFEPTLPPAQVAEKLLKRNLSDIAAMGGTPRHALVALAAPADQDVVWLEGFFRGLARQALRYGVKIIGGDCAQTDGLLGAWLTLLGDAPARPLTRSGARPGDLLFVTGSLGGSIRGRHVRFVPRLDEGRWLAGCKEVRAAIDISDGLAKDVAALVPANAVALIEGRHLPISAAARKLARRSGRSALAHAWSDGEDYELLFAVAPREIERFIRDWHRRFATQVSCIGRIVGAARGRQAGGRVQLLHAGSNEMAARGYEHF